MISEQLTIYYIYMYMCVYVHGCTRIIHPLVLILLLVCTTHRSNNPAILQLLLSLTGSLADRGVQGLITRAIATCPDMLTPYLQTVSLSFEPRPHSKWIENVDFLINVSSVQYAQLFCAVDVCVFHQKDEPPWQ